MNSQIIPQGCRELVDGSSSAVTKVLELTAIEQLVLANVVFQFPADPAHADVVDDLTLPVGQSLHYIESVTITSGLASLVYLPK